MIHREMSRDKNPKPPGEPQSQESGFVNCFQKQRNVYSLLGVPFDDNFIANNPHDFNRLILFD